MGTVPFTPLVDTTGPLPGEGALQQQLAADRQPFQPQDPGLEAFFGPSPTERARAYLQQADAQAGGLWPTFLATAAALKGQFGPAIALQEQKRKTSAAKAMLPFMDEIGRLRNQGKFTEMRQAAEQYSTEMGTRFPEAAELFKGVAQRAAKTEEDFLNAQAWLEVQKGKITSPDDPRARTVKTIDAVLKKRPMVGMDMIKQWANELEVKSQDIAGTLVQTVSGDVGARYTPTPVFARQGEQQDIVGNLVAGAHQITPVELTNVLNRVAIGQGSDTDKRIQEDYIAMLPYRAQIEAARLVPLEPIAATQMLAGGQDVLDIAARRVGPQGVSKALNEHYQRLIEQAKAPIIAGLELDPTRAKQAGYVPVNVNPAGNNFLAETGPMSFAQLNQLNAQGPQVSFIRTENVDKVLRPAQLAIDGLQHIGQMQMAYGDASTPLNRMERGINRIVADYLGVATTSTMAMGKAAEAIVRRSIERMEDTKLIDDRTIGQLKQMIAGPFADDAQALQAANVVQQRLRQEIAKVIGNYTVPDREAVGAMQQQPLQGPVQPAPGAAPGATPLAPIRGIQKGYQQRLQDLKVK